MKERYRCLYEKKKIHVQAEVYLYTYSNGNNVSQYTIRCYFYVKLFLSCTFNNEYFAF